MTIKIIDEIQLRYLHIIDKTKRKEIIYYDCYL